MNQEIEVGQRWYGTHPGACVVVEVCVDEITESTVLIRQSDWSYDYLIGMCPSISRTRYPKGEFNFIELLPPKPPIAPGAYFEVVGPPPPAPSFWKRLFGAS